MVKAVTLFLIAMAVMAIFFRHRVPRLGKPARCPACGRPRIGKAPCPCGGKGKA